MKVNIFSTHHQWTCNVSVSIIWLTKSLYKQVTYSLFPLHYNGLPILSCVAVSCFCVLILVTLWEWYKWPMNCKLFSLYVYIFVNMNVGNNFHCLHASQMSVLAVKVHWWYNVVYCDNHSWKNTIPLTVNTEKLPYH